MNKDKKRNKKKKRKQIVDSTTVVNTSDGVKNDISNKISERSREKTEKKVTCIVGDSLIKNMKGWELNKKLKNDIAVVKSFPGATIECMKDYIQPTLRKNPDRIIIHIGTNDLKSEITASKLSKNIINLAKSCSDAGSVVAISSLITRGDNLKGKLEAVNEILKKSCSDRNIGFIEHGNILENDLNGSKIHLNKKGSDKLDNNIIDFINKF